MALDPREMCKLEGAVLEALHLDWGSGALTLHLRWGAEQGRALLEGVRRVELARLLRWSESGEIYEVRRAGEQAMAIELQSGDVFTLEAERLHVERAASGAPACEPGVEGP